MTQYIDRKPPRGATQVKFTGPANCGRFKCNQQDGTIGLHNIDYPYLSEDLVGRTVNFDLMAGIESFVQKDNRNPGPGERIMWLEEKYEEGMFLKEVSSLEQLGQKVPVRFFRRSSNPIYTIIGRVCSLLGFGRPQLGRMKFGQKRPIFSLKTGRPCC